MATKKKKNIFQIVGGFIGGIFKNQTVKRVLVVPVLGIGISVSVYFSDGAPKFDIKVEKITQEQVQEIENDNDIETIIIK